MTSQRTALTYKIPESLSFNEQTSFYTKPPRKFVGYSQYANARTGSTILPSLSEPIKPFSLRQDNKKFGESKSVAIIEDRNPETQSVSQKTTSKGPKLQAVSHNTSKEKLHLDSKADANIAKLIQDQFNKTYSKRLSKVPSFMSTHLTKFTTSNVMGESTITHRNNLVPKFNLNDYDAIHSKIYIKENSFNRTTHAPTSRMQTERILADLCEREEDNLMMTEYGSLASTIRERSVSTLNSASGSQPLEENVMLKTADYFANKLRAQNIVKNLKMIEVGTKPERRQFKGTKGVHLPSPNELFSKDLRMLKTLYPQNYK